MTNMIQEGGGLPETLPSPASSAEASSQCYLKDHRGEQLYNVYLCLAFVHKNVCRGCRWTLVLPQLLSTFPFSFSFLFLLTTGSL